MAKNTLLSFCLAIQLSTSSSEIKRGEELYDFIEDNKGVLPYDLITSLL